MSDDTPGREPTPADDPGLEHDHATPEGELMTAAGSAIRDPHRHEDGLTLSDNPGLEHDGATDEGRMMTGSGSTGPDDGEERVAPAEPERQSR